MLLVTVLITVIIILSVMLIRALLRPKVQVNQFVSRSRRMKVSPVISRPINAFKTIVDRYESIPEAGRVEPRVEPTITQQSTAPTIDNVNRHHENADDVLGLNETAQPAEPVAITRPVFRPTMQAPVITLLLFADDGSTYGGYELLQALLSNGLRFGQQQIFHRYESKQAQGNIIFSCASILKPGTFDLAKMGGFSTTGLAIFLDTQEVKDPKAAFHIMLQTIDGIVEDLGGVVYDDRQRPFSKETLLDIHYKIDQYVQSCHTQDLFATP